MILKEFNPRTGPNSLAGQAVAGLLNRDNDDLTIMLRESVQNSWDARGKRSNDASIKYSFTSISFNNSELENFSRMLAFSDYSKKIAGEIRKSPYAFEIADTGTVGLTGPVDYETDTTEQDRYRKFVFEIGNTAQGEGAGGVFGFGKSSLYNASKIGTVVIYTRAITPSGGYEDRFIIKCIWPVSIFAEPALPPNSSGVFWWGKDVHDPVDKNRPACMHPLLGDEAVSAAASIGMSIFEQDETGTKLLVLAPKLDPVLALNDEDEELAENDEIAFRAFGVPTGGGERLFVSNHQKMLGELERMNRAAVHYFWAKYLIYGRSRGIIFKFAHRSSDEIVTNLEQYSPSNIHPYNLLIECHNAAKKGVNKPSVRLETISSSRPRADLGKIAWAEFSLRDMDPRFSDFFRDNKYFVALLRNVELVVQYKPVPARPQVVNLQDQKGIAGVFRTLDGVQVATGSNQSVTREVSEIFRAAENQTHGEWNHIKAGELGAYCATYVKVSLRRIDEVLNRAYPPTRNVSAPVPAGDATVMSFLGSFLQHSPGGAGVPPEPPPPQHGPGQGTISTRPALVFNSVLGASSDGNVTVKELRYHLNSTHVGKEYVLISPVCPDETGSLTLKPDLDGGLPVSIMSVRAQDSRPSLEWIRTNNNGTATLKVIRAATGIVIDIKVKITGDARFALDADYAIVNQE